MGQRHRRDSFTRGRYWFIAGYLGTIGSQLRQSMRKRSFDALTTMPRLMVDEFTHRNAQVMQVTAVDLQDDVALILMRSSVIEQNRWESVWYSVAVRKDGRWIWTVDDDRPSLLKLAERIITEKPLSKNDREFEPLWFYPGRFQFRSGGKVDLNAPPLFKCRECDARWSSDDQSDCSTCGWVRHPSNRLKWGRAGRCPRCGFSYRFDGERCSHCAWPDVVHRKRRSAATGGEGAQG